MRTFPAALPATVSDATDRALLPAGLQNAPIVAREWGCWTMLDFFGVQWVVTFGPQWEVSIELANGEDPEYVVTDFTTL
jgi:hypothetical protein